MPLLTAIIFFAGCSTTTSLQPDYMAAGSILLPAKPGSVGLVVVRPHAGFLLEGPHHRLEAAGAEATEGVKTTAGSELALLSPAAGVVGGVYGVLAGISENDLKAATTSLLTVCREVDFDGRVAQSVRERIIAACPGQWRELEEDLAADPGRTEGQVGSGAGKTASRGLILPPPRLRPAVDTVIRVRIVFRGFQVYDDPDPALGSDSIFHVLRQKHNPPLCVALTVDVTATRVRDLAPLGGITIRYWSPPRSFLDWAAHDARPFRHEMEAGLQLILKQLGTRLEFGLPPNSP